MKKKAILIIFAMHILGLAIFFSLRFFGEKKEEIKIENSKARTEEISNVDVSEESTSDGVAVADDAVDKDAGVPSSIAETAENTLKKEPVTNDSDKEESSDNSAEKSDTSKTFKIADRLVGWGYAKASERKIDTIILHSSYNSLGGDVHSLEKVLDIYKSYGVSPHYIISREGKAYRLVSDKNIAYHAGVSEVPDGRENVNDFSIGIEIINTKAESPNAAQYAALKKLIAYLKDEHRIKYVLGHSDIAPGRKDDPWKLDWGKVR